MDGGANLISTQVYAGSQPLAYHTAVGNTWTYEYQNQVGTESAREQGGHITLFTSLAYSDASGIGGPGPDVDAPYHFAGMDVAQTQIPFQQNGAGSHRAQLRDYSAQSGQWLSPDPYDGSYSLPTLRLLTVMSMFLTTRWLLPTLVVLITAMRRALMMS